MVDEAGVGLESRAAGPAVPMRLDRPVGSQQQRRRVAAGAHRRSAGLARTAARRRGAELRILSQERVVELRKDLGGLRSCDRDGAQRVARERGERGRLRAFAADVADDGAQLPSRREQS